MFTTETQRTQRLLKRILVLCDLCAAVVSR